MTILDEMTLAADVRTLALGWFAALDRKDPLDSSLDAFALRDLRLRFPEGEFRGESGLREWHASAMRTFFDTRHTVHSLDVTVDSDGVIRLCVFVTWEASTWAPPAARSARSAFDIRQEWRLVAGLDGRPRVTSYVVLDAQPISAPLEGEEVR